MNNLRPISTLAGGLLSLFAHVPVQASSGSPPGDNQALLMWAALALLAVGMVAGLVILLWRRQRTTALLARAQVARERQDAGKAQKLFSRAIRRLQKKKELAQEETGLLQEAHLGLAYVHETQERPQEAAKHYLAALETGLELEKFPPYGLISLAQSLAQIPDTGDRALEVYLAYLALKLRPINPQVAAVLEKMGACPEAEPSGVPPKPQKLAQVVRIARLMTQADPQRLWPHLSLGMAAVLSRNFDEALPHLVQAARLAPDHPATYYWMGKALAAKAEPYPAGIRQAYIKFLSLSRNAGECGKRAETAYFLGFTKPLGYAFRWIDPPTLNAGEEAEFDESANWLERAVAEGKTDAETYYLLAVAHFLLGRLPQATLALVHAVAGSPQYFPYRFALGTVYLAAGQRPEAEREYCQAILLSPGDQETRRLLMHFYLEDNRWPEVAEQCRTLLDLAGPELPTLGTLVLALSRQGKFTEVVALAAALRPFTDEPQALPIVFLMGRAQSLTLNFTEALAWYDLLLAQQDQPEARYYRACALGRLGRVEEALTAFQALSETGSDYRAEAHLQRGHLFFLQGRHEEALDSYQRALEFKPEESEIYYALGTAAYHHGQAPQALIHFTKCLELAPDHTGSLLGAGLAREQTGERAEARRDYRQVIELEPNNRTAQERLAILACQAGDYDRSLQYFMSLEEQALERDQSLYHLGYALVQKEELSLALKIWSRLAARHPDDRELQELAARNRYLLGQRLLQAGHYVEAADLWDQYLKVFPEDLEARRGLAEMLWRLALSRLKEEEPGMTEAEELLLKAGRLDGDNWKYPYFLAQVFWAAGRPAEAAGLLQQLAERWPADPRIQYHLGLVSLLLGHQDQALAAWRTAAGSEGADPYAAYALLALANESVAQGDYHQAADFLATGWKMGAPGQV